VFNLRTFDLNINNQIPEIMKKEKITAGSFLFIAVLVFLMTSTEAAGQLAGAQPLSIPDNVNKIFTTSCIPCHTSSGGLLSKAKLNFTSWKEYSREKQKEKAEAILSMLEKGKMPPKAARENRPDIIPSKDQIQLIKIWAGSFKTDDKK
jgi:mono/diheme cytochrome c family protein